MLTVHRVLTGFPAPRVVYAEEIEAQIMASIARQQDTAFMAMRPQYTKPRIRKVFNVQDARYEYRCSDTTAFCNAWADTQEAAYEGWLRQFAEWRRRQLE